MKVVYHATVNVVLALMLAGYAYTVYGTDPILLAVFILFVASEAGAPDTDITRRGSLFAVLAYSMLGLLGLRRGHRESFHRIPGIIAYAATWLLVVVPASLVINAVAARYGLDFLYGLDRYLYAAMVGSVFTFIEHIYFDTATRHGITILGKQLRGIIKYGFTDDELTEATVTGVFGVLLLSMSFDVLRPYSYLIAFVFGHTYVPWSWKMFGVLKKKKRKRRLHSSGRVK